MKQFALLFLLMYTIPSFSQTNGNNEILETVHDVVQIFQPDNTSINVRGIGNSFVSYTETTDGYTIVLNEDYIYVYALQSRAGDLIPSGVKANDPEQRNKQESKFLRKAQKHLRYKNPTLQQFIDKQNQWQNDIKNE